MVTGCRNSTFIDVHHLVPRAAGGQHELENLVCLCGAHHRAVHENTLVIEGRPATGLRFFHSDGRRYGNVGSHSQGETHPRRIDAEGQVTGALKGLGFRDGEVRWALQHCQVELGSDATPEEILRCSLEYLAARAV